MEAEEGRSTHPSSIIPYKGSENSFSPLIILKMDHQIAVERLQTQCKKQTCRASLQVLNKMLTFKLTLRQLIMVRVAMEARKIDRISTTTQV